MRKIAMSKRTDYDIFLSYSNRDKSWVIEFVSALKDAGIKTWFDVHDITPGERWDEKIQQALRESSIIVVILSENSVESPWIFFELGAAIADKKRIIPVLVGDIESKRIPILLRRFQSLKEASPAEAGKRIAKVIEQTSLRKTENQESLVPTEG